MAYQEVTRTGYGTRVGNSFKGIGMGFILFIGATILLWWNEGRAVKTKDMLNEVQNVCVDMENPNKKDPALDGEVVCASALATTEDSLIDKQFNIGAKAIALNRTVEYYQWVEHSSSKSEDKLGGAEETTTTYTYKKEWVSSPINSSDFKDPAYQGKNSTLSQYEEESQWAENVSFGAYKLNGSLIKQISSTENFDLNIDQKLLEDINKQIAKTKGKDVTQQKEQAAAKPDTATVADNKMDLDYVHVNGNELYLGESSSAPEIGDVRITFEKVVPAKVTIIAQVSGDTFKSYKAKNGKHFQILVMGKQSSDEIIDGQKSVNNMLLWLFRIVGIMLVIAGLKGIFAFLSTLLKVIPFLSNIVGWGVGVVCTVIGVVWSLIIIAIAWLFYRPLLGIGLLVLAGFLIWVFAFKGKEKLKELAKRNGPQAAPAPVQEN